MGRGSAVHSLKWRNYTMNRYTLIILFVVIALIHHSSEALVSPCHHPCCKHPRKMLHAKASYEGGAPFIYGRCLDNEYRMQRRMLHSSAAIANGAENGDGIDEESPVNEFEPRTMSVSQSFHFFARFVVQTILDKRAQKSLGRENRRRLRDRFKRNTEVAKKKNKAKSQTGIRASLRKLNESRQNLIRLVGYDSSLLVPAFGYLIMGALMSSIIPVRVYCSACPLS